MLETGQIIPVKFKGRKFNAIVVAPNGLGAGKPSIGVSSKGMSRHLDMPASTLQRRVLCSEDADWLELSSGKSFRVLRIDGNDGNEYNAIEVSDWVEIAADWLKTPGRLSKKGKEGLIDFLAWCAAEGLYAQAYTFLKQTYTCEDSEIIQRWLVSREASEPCHKNWAYEIADKDRASPYKYGRWTNYIYRGVFGMDAAEMKEIWKAPVSSFRPAACNYIPESVGLEMVAYCEKLVSVFDLDDLERTHDEAIRMTQIKFQQRLDSQRLGG